MNDTKETLIKSALHTAEVAVLGGVALFVVYMFRDDADVMGALKDVVLNVIPLSIGAFAGKFARESKAVNVPDYINDR